MVVCRTSDQKTEVAPVRLAPTWKRSFTELVSEAEQKSMQALSHGAHAFNILASDLRPEGSDGMHPVFAAGYVCSKPGNEGVTFIEKALDRYYAGSRRLTLVLEITGEDETLDGRLMYRPIKLQRESVVKLSSYFGAILGDVSRNVNIALGDIALTEESREDTTAKVLAGDTFTFG